MNGLPNWLWPEDAGVSDGCLSRLGRVFHWFFTLVAIGIWIGGCVAGFYFGWPSALGCLAGGVFWYFVGRVIRYVMADE